MSEDAFSLLMTSADPALVVVTTSAQDHRAGCLVGFHSQSSITPEHYCVWLSKANHTYRVALRAHRFCVHFLTSDDLAMAERFGSHSGADVDKFADLDVDVHDGVPEIRACPNRILIERIALLDDGGDHVCLTSRVLDSWTDGPFRPLRVSDAADLEPGHDSEERAIRP